MPATIDGNEIEAVTIGGDEVSEITMDGDVVWEAVEIIDDFEDGSSNNWHVPSSTGEDAVVSPSFNGSTYAWRLFGFREAHLAGADAVDRGPQPGDQFQYRFRVNNYGADPALFRFEFASAGVSDDNRYYVEYELNDPDSDVALYKGGTNETSQFKTFNVSETDIIGGLVRWNYGDDKITVSNYVNLDLKNVLTITDTEYTNPGISLFVNANLTIDIDGIRITDTI